MRIDGHAGLYNLRRYFELIVFQAYLQSTEPDTMQNFESFESFVQKLPGVFPCARSHPICAEYRPFSDQDV